jgi:hypothetical protein
MHTQHKHHSANPRTSAKPNSKRNVLREPLQVKTENEMADNTTQFTYQQLPAINQSKQQRPFRVKLSKHSKPKNELGELDG